MIKLKTIDNKLVGIAIGKDSNDDWYVQTTDIKHDTYLSESIQEGLKYIDHALSIAKIYSDRYNMKIVVWEKERVFVEGFGYGIITNKDMLDDFPIFVEFEDESLHESDKSGLFKIDQLSFKSPLYQGVKIWKKKFY